MRAVCIARAVGSQSKELNICGWQAVSMLFAKHPAEIKRLFFDPPTGKRTAEISRYLATQKKIYRQVPAEELEKISGTVHHGGIVAVIAERPLKKVTRDVGGEWAKTRAPLLVLDRVGNANNLGAIVRSAAFFGVKAIVLPDHPAQALPGEAAYRVAEGGMEFVDFYRVPTLPEFLPGVETTPLRHWHQSDRQPALAGRGESARTASAAGDHPRQRGEGHRARARRRVRPSRENSRRQHGRVAQRLRRRRGALLGILRQKGIIQANH